MTVLDTTTRFTPAPARTFVHRVIAAVAAWSDARATRDALSHLSDHELDDIGLVRGDIDTLAEGDPRR